MLPGSQPAATRSPRSPRRCIGPGPSKGRARPVGSNPAEPRCARPAVGAPTHHQGALLPWVMLAPMGAARLALVIALLAIRGCGGGSTAPPDADDAPTIDARPAPDARETPDAEPGPDARDWPS